MARSQLVDDELWELVKPFLPVQKFALRSCGAPPAGGAPFTLQPPASSIAGL